jgi:hypothetical protein
MLPNHLLEPDTDGPIETQHDPAKLSGPVNFENST